MGGRRRLNNRTMNRHFLSRSMTRALNDCIQNEKSDQQITGHTDHLYRLLYLGDDDFAEIRLKRPTQRRQISLFDASNESTNAIGSAVQLIIISGLWHCERKCKKFQKSVALFQLEKERRNVCRCRCIACLLFCRFLLMHLEERNDRKRLGEFSFQFPTQTLDSLFMFFTGFGTHSFRMNQIRFTGTHVQRTLT